MDWLRDFWTGLTEVQRTVIIGAVILFAFFVLGSFIFAGTDYSGFGDWIRSWFS